VRFAIAQNWFNPPIKVIDRTKAKLNISWRNHLGNHKQKQKTRKNEEHKNSLFYMSVASWCSVGFCAVLYWPVCHGVLKLDLSLLFTKIFL